MRWFWQPREHEGPSCEIGGCDDEAAYVVRRPNSTVLMVCDRCRGELVSVYGYWMEDR